MYEKMCGYFRIISQAGPDGMSELMSTLQREVSEDMGGDLLVLALGSRWAQQDPIVAYEALLAGQTPGLEQSLEQILQAVVREDPRAAWEMMIESDGAGSGLLGNARERDRFIGELIAAITVEDGTLAKELISTLENPASFRVGMDASLQALAETDPGAFLVQLDEIDFASASVRNRAIETAFARLAARDLESARGHLDQLEGLARKHAELGLAEAWSRSDPAAALAWAEGLHGATRTRAQSEIMRQLAQRDPAQAALELEQLESPSLRQELAKSIADAWAGRDRDAAVAWVREELEGRAREESYAELLRNHIQSTDFDSEFGLLKEMADGSPEAGWGHYQFANEWARRDPQATAEWSLGRINHREEIFGHVVEQWAGSDIDGLERFSSTLQDEAIRKIVEERLSRHRESQSAGEGQP